MKTITNLILIAAAALLLIGADNANAQNNYTARENVLLATVETPAAPSAPPAQITSEIPGLPAYSTNGLSFTNIWLEGAFGTESVTSGGTLAYVEGNIDLFKINSTVHVGFGLESALSSTGNGFHSADANLEAINDISNWQLIFKLGYGRTLEANIGNYFGAEFEINYNLYAGTGLSYLGTTGGNFTYVGGNVRYETSKLDATMNQAEVQKMVRIYIGYAFGK